MTALTPEREAEIRARDMAGLPRHSDVGDLLAALDATRAELVELREADIERARLALLLETATADAKRWEVRAYEARAERDAHARDLALLAEVRGHEMAASYAVELDQDAHYSRSLRRDFALLLVRLLRGEG